ncbi:MAG: peptide-binding protein [Candidatus Goldiibacteriota bacterium]
MLKKYFYMFFMGLFFLSAGCSRDSGYSIPDEYEDKPFYGGMLIDSSIGEPSILNPVLASDSSSSDITELIFNGLVKFDKNLKLTGDLAESWEIKDDGKLIVFHLKKGVKWHDGADFTAEDVKFTYEKYMDPGVKTAYRSLFEPVSRVVVKDDYTLEVYYEKPFAPALQYWGASIIPRHILHDKDFNSAEFNRNPVGTGPYVFKKWLTARQIELEANENYFDGKPYISRYIYRIIPDQSVQFMELASGSVDMMSLNSDLYFSRADTPEFKKKFNKFKIPAFTYVYIGYNNENPLFADKKVRQALSYAVNRKEIIKNVKLGLARPISGPFIPGSAFYNENVPYYRYDIEKAEKLLNEAGWRKNSSGMLEKDGKPFEFTLMTNQGNKERETIAAITQQQLSKLGIKVEIRVLAWSIFITEFINKRKFDAVVMGWSLTRDPDCYDIWHSSKTKEGEFNFIAYSNPEVDRLCIEGREVYDPEKRAEIYRKIHSLISEDAPYTFLYNPFALPAVHKRIHGIKPEPAGIGYNFTKWYIPEDLIKYAD